MSSDEYENHYGCRHYWEIEIHTILGLKVDIEPRFSIKILSLGNFRAKNTRLEIWKNLKVYINVCETVYWCRYYQVKDVEAFMSQNGPWAAIFDKIPQFRQFPGQKDAARYLEKSLNVS